MSLKLGKISNILSIKKLLHRNTFLDLIEITYNSIVKYDL